MAQSNSQIVLSSDRPGTDPAGDRLGYSNLAKYLAKTICQMPPAEGVVIGVYGKWGSGKSTFLNYVLHYIDTEQSGYSPLVVKFNPWWFPPNADLMRTFFLHVAKKLCEQEPVVWARISGQFQKLADAVCELSIPIKVGVLGTSIEIKSNDIAKAALKLFGKESDLDSIKKTIGNELGKLKRRIIVVIDDLDRLSVNEIQQIFKVVKAVADFPNMIYLLAFDKDIVAKAVSSVQELPGDEYLEKIVQFPLDLPVPSKSGLNDYFYERLSVVLKQSSGNAADIERLAKIYSGGIEYFVPNIRSICRLINAIGVTYPSVMNEVNAIDFVGMECLRVFKPVVYREIHQNLRHFTGHSDLRGYHGPKLAESAAYHARRLKELVPATTELSAINKVLSELFPKTQAPPKNSWWGEQYLRTWRTSLRVCSPDCVENYFRFSVVEGDISNTEMQALLGIVNDGNALFSRLEELSKQKHPSGRTRLAITLDRFLDFVPEIGNDDVLTVLGTLLEHGDKLWMEEDTPRSMFDCGDGIRLSRIIYNLLLRIPIEDRLARFTTMCETSQSLGTLFLLVDLCLDAIQDASFEFLPQEDLLKVREILISRAKIELGTISKAKNLLEILTKLQSSLSPKDFDKFFEAFLKTDGSIVSLLELRLWKFFAFRWPDTIPDEFTYDVFTNLDDICFGQSPKTIVAYAEKLDIESLTPRQKIAIKAAIKKLNS